MASAEEKCHTSDIAMLTTPKHTGSRERTYSKWLRR